MSLTQFNFSNLVSRIIAEEVRKKESYRIKNEIALHLGKLRVERSIGEKSSGSRCSVIHRWEARKLRAAKIKDNGGNGSQNEGYSKVMFSAAKWCAGNCWLTDSGATAYVFKDSEALVEYVEATTTSMCLLRMQAAAKS